MSIATAAAVRLGQIDQGETKNKKKSRTLSPLFPATDSAPTLSTSFQKVSGRFDCGNNDEVEFRLLWTKSSGTVLTVAYKTSFDDAVLTAYAFEPEYGSPVAGVYTADIAEISFTAATFSDAAITDGTTIINLKARFKVKGARFVEVWAKSDNASGSISGYAVAGR